MRRNECNPAEQIEQCGLIAKIKVVGGASIRRSEHARRLGRRARRRSIMSTADPSRDFPQTLFPQSESRLQRATFSPGSIATPVIRGIARAFFRAGHKAKSEHFHAEAELVNIMAIFSIHRSSLSHSLVHGNGHARSSCSPPPPESLRVLTLLYLSLASVYYPPSRYDIR